MAESNVINGNIYMVYIVIKVYPYCFFLFLSTAARTEKLDFSRPIF